MPNPVNKKSSLKLAGTLIVGDWTLPAETVKR